MRFYFRIAFVLTFFAASLANYSFAQAPNFPKPREEKLLNDLKLLVWYQPNAEKVTVKIRIHSGSAFDPKDKMGTIALLSEVLFPDEGIKRFFKEDLDGSLEVVSDYDYIQVNATAKSTEFLTILETLGPALLNPTINKETTAKVKAKRLDLVAVLENDPSYIAERAVAKQLLGDFPYGRPKEGTKTSVSKIDFADLIFAKQRFMTSDNATIAVIGNIKSNFAYRAVRRHFGGWGKRTDKIPSSFRLPREPDTQLSIISTSKESVSELRFAAKASARKDVDYFPNLVLARIYENRSVAGVEHNVQVKNNLLPSYVLFRFPKWNVGSVKISGKTASLLKPVNADFEKLMEAPITQEEFSKAKSSVLSDYESRNISDLWFDVDTYRLSSLASDWKDLKNVNLAAVNKAERKWKSATLAKAIVATKVDKVDLNQDPDPKDPKK